MKLVPPGGATITADFTDNYGGQYVITHHLDGVATPILFVRLDGIHQPIIPASTGFTLDTNGRQPVIPE